MNNREIIDYILSGNLKENDVIKRIEHYHNNESITYLWNDEFDLYDDNGKVSIISFEDAKESLETYYTYEIISKEQAENEIEKKEKQQKIKRLEEELKKLKGE